MTQALFVLGWTAVGAALGIVVRLTSVRLATLEDLEPGDRAWQRYGPSLLAGLLFAAIALRLAPGELLLIKSLWILVLVQVIFFDFEHRLILDRVMVPAMVAALLLSVITPELGAWWGARLKMSLVTGAGAGLLFFLIALAGRLTMGGDALGMGDVKLAVFIGLILGFIATFHALLYGVLIAGFVAVALMVVRRRARGMTFAYGPWLAAGALIMLLQA